MPQLDSIVPVDHWTTGLSDDELRALARRHAVRSEIGPQQAVAHGELVREGWDVDLYGERGGSEPRHVHDVLHAIATAVLPEVPAGLIVDVEPFTGAVVLNPHRDFAEEVRLRIHVLREVGGREDEARASDTEWTHALTSRLEALGVRR